MRVLSLFSAAAFILLFCGNSMHAQQTAGAGIVSAADRGTRPVQAGDRSGAPLGSPDISPSDTSTYPPYQLRDLRLGGIPGTVYPPDAVPPTPAGMLAHSEPGNPAMVYFALPHRSGSDLSANDAAIVAARQHDLISSAAYRGYDLHQSGWLYQQAICPQTQPASPATVETLVPADGQGSILLHFVRHEDGRVSSFTAVVPRDSSLPVRTIGVAHGSMEQHHDFLSVDTTGAVVNEALPPRILHASMQPLGGWIAASACIAELGGAYPHIPDEPSLSRAITTAPAPYLRLGLHGNREVWFTDRVDAKHYVVWDEQVTKTGKMLKAHRRQFTTIDHPATNPPLPKTKFEASIPQPPSRVKPYPPGPTSAQLR
jgi:hypothetical protein